MSWELYYATDEQTSETQETGCLEVFLPSVFFYKLSVQGDCCGFCSFCMFNKAQEAFESLCHGLEWLLACKWWPELVQTTFKN